MSVGGGTVSVLIVDDHAVVRAGVRTLLAAADAIEVVGDADSPAAALSAAVRLDPDVILLDISMPGQSGLDLLPELRRRAPRSAVIALSVHDEREYAVAMERAGARGFLRKDCDPRALIDAIRRAASGGTAFSERATELIVAAHIRTAGGTGDSPAPLTHRQREVLIAIATGLSGPAIARRLGISPRTVESHRAAIQARLGIQSVAELTRYAIARGYVSLD